MTANSVAAIVDVYDIHGKFVKRIDFTGATWHTVHEFASAIGRVERSGVCIPLTDVEVGGLAASTYISDEAYAYSGRETAPDTQGTAAGLHVFVVETPAERPRNPLHPQALMIDELAVGMQIQQYESGRAVSGSLTITGDPFVEVISEEQGTWVWHLPVTDDAGPGPRNYLIDLGEAGIARYGRWFRPLEWNPTNYSLTV